MRCLLLIVTALAGAPAAHADDEKGRIDFVRDVRPIFERHCYECHAGETPSSALRLDVKAAAFRGGEAYGASIVPGKPNESPLVQFVADAEADLRMPPEGRRLSAEEIATLTKWVAEGAVWPDGVDTAVIVDKSDHWAFDPVVRHEPPAVADEAWPRTTIDRFVLAQLEESGLAPADEADRRTWLRRVRFDLTGLPPTPTELADFLADERPGAHERVVDRLLASPHYGERWAQHWLDVVRYADTHGFEVNTPRPNAWPYRDYVVSAFNDDRPYDQFVREQIAGDGLGRDEATGFLVTAAALLPGQIGKDEASKRLARQDELAEMLTNVGETFLGLSIGCARCHDHMFDAITQRDYYTMQAMLRGVRYGDRPIRSPATPARMAEAESLRERVDEIDKRLAELAPLAHVGPLRETNAKRNEERFEPVEARFVRFTIHAANRHPSLGIIEPCLDEFEVFAADEPTRNVALASAGAKVTATGSRTSAAHRLEHVNDGRYGNARSWMSNEAGRGGILLELPETTRIDRVVWSRDRLGQYTDRLATAFTLEVGLTLESMRRVAHVPPSRPAVVATRNVDRFPPTTTTRLRFTLLGSNEHAPCLDELEVFDVDGRNVALASAGTTATSSDSENFGGKHRIEYVNDGRYGNGRSWIVGKQEGSWVELTFPRAHEIDRVVWGRDRDGKFRDRVPVAYEIAVFENGGWRPVATSEDRRPFGEASSEKPQEAYVGLPASEANLARELVAERDQLTERIEDLETLPVVFGARSTKPEETRLLFRGDAEQPRDVVPPAALSVLGDLELSIDASDLERRRALADWIADAENPLTARVMVNRIWHGHFGTGLVDTVSDFGRKGGRPSHPELLDWLASEFVRSGWSVKHLHRLVVLSATYRQSHRISPEAQAVDADVRFLWRFPSRRLEAEAIRDAMLLASNRLNRRPGGPGFDFFGSRGGLSGFPPVESFSGDGLRRMIYAHKVRMERDAVFGAFDCPDAGQSMPRRRRSTTPIQALNLLNSRFTIEEAEALAERVRSDVGDDPEAGIRRCYLLTLGREPDAEELRDITPVVREHGLEPLCRALFNGNEFLFLP